MNNEIIIVGLVRNHHSFYVQLIDILINLNKTVTILTFEKNKIYFKKYSAKSVNVIYEEGGFSEITLKYLQLINTYTLLIIDELFDGLKMSYKLKFRNKLKISFIHNSNKWFYNNSSKLLNTSVRSYLKKRYIKQFDAFIVMGPNIRDFLISLNIQKPIFVLPFDMGNVNIMEPSDHSEIIITIPGMIDQERRDYLGLLHALFQYYSNNPTSRIRLKLLGRLVNSTDYELINAIKRINTRFGEYVFYWKDFIPDKEYDNHLLQTDLFLSNLKPVTISDYGNEIYGITKETGITFAIIKYAKPAIIPFTHQVLFEMQSQIQSYLSHDDLMIIFHKLEKESLDLASLQSCALENRIQLNKKFNDLKEYLANYINEGLN